MHVILKIILKANNIEISTKEDFSLCVVAHNAIILTLSYKSKPLKNKRACFLSSKLLFDTLLRKYMILLHLDICVCAVYM